MPPTLNTLPHAQRSTTCCRGCLSHPGRWPRGSETLRDAVMKRSSHCHIPSLLCLLVTRQLTAWEIRPSTGPRREGPRKATTHGDARARWALRPQKPRVTAFPTPEAATLEIALGVCDWRSSAGQLSSGAAYRGRCCQVHSPFHTHLSSAPGSARPAPLSHSSHLERHQPNSTNLCSLRPGAPGARCLHSAPPDTRRDLSVPPTNARETWRKG